MSPKLSLPKIDPRKASKILEQLREMVPHYTREWPARDKDDPGVALLKIFSSIAEGVVNRLNRAPERNFLAFLDVLGVRRLPATPARAPVRFLIAKGTEDPFEVPLGTQVSAGATPKHPELPFETLKTLWAIPSALLALMAVDPEADRIYQAPPGFLALELAASELPPLNVTAFCSAGSNFLQLDPPGQVAEGDFLRIEQVSKLGGSGVDCIPKVNEQDLRIIDHLVVGGVKGPIVTVTDPLPRDYVEDTQVRKETQFELFEAKNWQEHVLFLAHADYFAIKSEAQFELRVDHAAGISANLEPLKVVWEFFGATEAEKEKGDTWHQFKVDVDGTQGLSRNGRVILIKPAGEVKETEINGYKSRWIRARLDEPLPAIPGKDLPKLDSITFKVSLGGAGLVADQAFNNDTPLTPDGDFAPFGTEPRIFDRFSIASKEAFSKPGAEVTLDLQLDFTDLLASPVAIFSDKKIKAFAHGAAGKLIEFQIDPVASTVDPIPHRSPADTRLVGGGVPSVVEAPNGITGVFVRVDDGRIHLRYIPSPNLVDWLWIDLENRKLPGELAFDPAALLFSKWFVYVVSDNRVHVLEVTPQRPNAGDWKELTSTNNTDRPAAASTPFPFLANLSTGPRVWVAVTDNDGHTWIHDGTDWKQADPEKTYLAAKNARPFAITTPANGTNTASDVRVFVRGAEGALILFTIDPNNSSSIVPKSFVAPSAEVTVASNVFAFATNTSAQLFVRGSDNQLWEGDLTTASWRQHFNPLDAKLAGDPFALAYTASTARKGNVLSLLSTSNKNSLLEFRTRGGSVETGLLRAGPDHVILLEDVIASTPEHFIRITSGPGVNSDEDATRKIDDIDRKFAVLDDPLDEIPVAETRYQVFEEIDKGNVFENSTSDDKVTLQKPAQPGNFLFVKTKNAQGKLKRQLRMIKSMAGNIATIESTNSWRDRPNKDDEYFVLKSIATLRKAQVGSARRVVLGPVGTPAQSYVDLFIEMTAGPNLVTRRIVNYIGAVRGVVLDANVEESPLENSQYTITVGNVREGWKSYRDPNQTELRPELSWEYWNGTGWVNLDVKDTTENFLVPGKVIFTLPEDIAKTEVAGQDNFWIRARIVGGDYGREQVTVEQKTGKIKVEKDPIRPPLAKSLTITYKLTELKPPQFCLTLNNLSYLDQTASNDTRDKHFSPYIPLADKNKAVYFGFDREFEGGPVRVYFAARELEVDERNKPKLKWEFAFNNDWAPLRAEDDTDAFTKPDFLTLNVPPDFQNSQQFGQALYWLRATLTEGSWSKSPLFTGVFVNTVEAQQARTITNELLGSSTGVKNQLLKFQQVPVLPGEEVRVREALTDEERDQLAKEHGEVTALTVEDAEQQKKEQGKDTVLSIKDQEGRVLQTWIRWTEVQEFFSSGSTDRHYRLDRASGEIEFGDGIHGRIPPAGGENIQAFSYQAGGGIGGNVAAGEITSPVSAVAGVDSVINPVAAGGGSEAATMDEMLEIGPAQISHRERAVTPEDFERLAREASREVRKARCLPNRNANGRHELGWTSVYIVPDASNATPSPSLELRRAVQRYLADRADLTVVDQKHIFVGAPEYVPVSVDVKVFAKSIDAVAAAEQSVQQKLERFLHPLSGGPLNEGWDFGRDLAASDLYSLLEDIPEVDHVASLQLSFAGSQSSERVEVGADALLASGTHKITMDVAVGE